MKGEKIAVRVMNLLLSAFFAFGILVFLEQFSRTGWAWYSRSLRCWPILLCFAVGIVGRLTPKWKYPLLGASVLVALGIMVPFWPAFGKFPVRITEGQIAELDFPVDSVQFFYSGFIRHRNFGIQQF